MKTKTVVLFEGLVSDEILNDFHTIMKDKGIVFSPDGLRGLDPDVFEGYETRYGRIWTNGNIWGCYFPD